MDCNLPDSTVHGIAILFSRGSSWFRGRIQISHTAGRFFTVWATRGAVALDREHIHWQNCRDAERGLGKKYSNLFPHYWPSDFLSVLVTGRTQPMDSHAWSPHRALSQYPELEEKGWEWPLGALWRITCMQFRSVHSLRRVRLFATPWTAACQASLSITNSRSLPKLMSSESVMPSNHLILCCPLLLRPSIFPSTCTILPELSMHIFPRRSEAGHKGATEHQDPGKGMLWRSWTTYFPRTWTVGKGHKAGRQESRLWSQERRVWSKT